MQLNDEISHRSSAILIVGWTVLCLSVVLVLGYVDTHMIQEKTVVLGTQEVRAPVYTTMVNSTTREVQLLKDGVPVATETTLSQDYFGLHGGAYQK